MAATAATTRRWSIAAHPLSLGGGGDSSAHAQLPLTQRPLDLFFVFYFITHVPTSLLVDAQCVLPPGNFPQAARDALAYHLETFKDPLMGTCPAWLRSIIWCELALQVPFFILATYAFCARKNWIRMPSIAYGVHTATTLAPILGSFWLSGSGGYGKLTVAERAKLTALYLPYLVVPLLLALRMALSPEPFGKNKTKKG